MSLEQLLADGLRAQGLALSSTQQQKLLDYLALLHKWNRVYNLTAVRDPEKMVAHHLLDSLSVLPQVPAGTLLDVGCGAGLPGIPLAIARPDVMVTMLDSNHKKTTFVQQVCIQLALANANVVCARVEKWQPPQLFDCSVSRAFSDLGEFVRRVAPKLKQGGILLAMKGVYPNEELAQLPREARVEQVFALTVPGLDAQRHLVTLRLQH
jgi:16S rRNA (guanine527-N7)-methyltransferase